MADGATQHHLVLILARDFASRLATPVFLVDAEGSVIYFNEGAERVLGRRFMEGSGMDANEWSTVFSPTDDDGNPVELTDLPLGVAIIERHPDHRMLRIKSVDGTERRIEVTAFPLFAHKDECLGAIAVFWEIPDEPISA
jgi:PAS domain-containing protein